MPVNHMSVDTINDLNTSMSAIYNKAFSEAKPIWPQIAEKAQSSKQYQRYVWMKQVPGMKKFIDERQIDRLERTAYTIENEKFEDTVAVSRDDIEDDDLGSYAMGIKGLATAAAIHPDELVFDALKTGFNNPCYDGQNFFDTDHPVVRNGAVTTVSNMQPGAGPTWFLLATNQAIKPLIYQERIKPELATIDTSNADHVFKYDEYLYGVRSRGAAGYGFWQMAFASKAPLTAENYELARVAMMELKGDKGRSLNIVPNLIIVPPALSKPAKELFKVERTANGATNVNQNDVEILTTPLLAA